MKRDYSVKKFAALFDDDNSVYYNLIAAIVIRAKKDFFYYPESRDEVRSFFEENGTFDRIGPPGLEGRYILREIEKQSKEEEEKEEIV